MDGLLTPVSTSYITKNDSLVQKTNDDPPKKVSLQHPTTPQEALEVLKSEPDYETLISTLGLLIRPDSRFSIHSPGPLESQILHVLVAEIVPNYWSVLSASDHTPSVLGGSKKSKRREGSDALISCLRSIQGLNAILLGIREHVQAAKATTKRIGGHSNSEILGTLLAVLESVLDGDTTIKTLWSRAKSATSGSETQTRALWSQFLPLVTGKISGYAAEAEIFLSNIKSNASNKYWTADSKLFASWVARNIVFWVKSLSVDEEAEWKASGEVLSKSFRLGHTDSLIKELLYSLLLRPNAQQKQIPKLIGYLPNFEQRKFLVSTLNLLAKDHLSSEITTEADCRWWESDKNIVGASAALINILVAKEECRRVMLVSWLTSSSGAGLGDGIAIRRAVITALAEDKNDIETVLEKSFEQLGDQLYIKHVPSMQQEVHAQVLLLAAGFVYRRSPIRFAIMMRAGAHLKVVSNRLGASSLRARFLGMVVAEALSSLVDQGDKRMDFKMDETKTPEALWYKGLVNVADTVGSLALLQSSPVAEHRPVPKPTKPPPTPKRKAPPPQTSKIIAIEEVSDDDSEENSDSEDDGLTPYAKPDSDPDDSDEDPTLITRNKPTAPVYIRNLITYLRSSENYDHQKLGLVTAAPLIRRKANFGTELSSHAEDLACILVGIQDKYEIENFDQLRLQGMVALVVAQPLKMAPWFAKTYFDGDYSTSQRASVLTTLGLAARELGGFSSETDAFITSTTEEAAASSSFPSKHLPENTHKRFTPLPASATSSLKPISSLTTHLQTAFLAPLAASIADQSLGPDILKLRTISSRYKSSSRSTNPKAGTRKIENTLATTLATSFFFPLTGRFFLHLKSNHGGGLNSSHNVFLQPYLLAHFLKTLSILLHASGPSTLSLPQMTIEFWDLLLNLRTHAVGDISVLEALLFSFLTLLEINEEKRALVEENGGRLVETQGWVEGVFAKLGSASGREGKEEGQVRMLAAGILVRIGEVVERYQALLVGDLMRLEG